VQAILDIDRADYDASELLKSRVIEDDIRETGDVRKGKLCSKILFAENH
jgi:hypothetical protein